MGHLTPAAPPLNTKGALEITHLDFDEIRDLLKIYLKGQAEFTDYDFDGSGLSILLDVLSYNTHYSAFMANMLANEMFLETAVKRSSIVSHAKAIGYTPTSATAPVAYVNVEVRDAAGPAITLNAGHIFNATVASVPYQFVNIADKTVIPENGIYIFKELPIFEGTWVETKYTVNLSDPDQKFILDNKNVDISTLKVKVTNSSSDSVTTTFSKANNLVEVTSETNAFFVQETIDEKWEVYFGDGIVGTELINGNIITLNYVITNKTEANGASHFISASSIGGFSDIAVAIQLAASGGAEPENTKSIKFKAPFNYAAQNRAVTANDYKVLIPQIYPNIASIAVWGGEYNDPPVYGKVYISIKPSGGRTLTDTTKADIKKKLKDYTVASVTPEIINPTIIKIIPSIYFKYNTLVTTQTSTALETLVRAAVTLFATEELEQFAGIFRYSQFISKVDTAENSIESNITTVQISKTITPIIDTSTKYTMQFNNSLYHPHDGHKVTSISSTGFTITGNTNTLFFDDNGSGILRIYYLVGTVQTYLDETAGTVDYTTGEVVVDAIIIDSVVNTDDTITFTILPNSNDIVPVRNQILEFDMVNCVISGSADTIASGSSNAGTGVTTSSSYGSSM